ncbi:hypothetical protein Val02_35620 [Virgisporangium aliadipatigenens]|uniref:Peptidase S1 domain-containing protein n=1 Tax=Virgisporangium aliadipatigenens TaxID=741659 RepID=A0A8J4DR40_9ACTN|nr:trypsin-like serine protease [Virgisporangium aliadipatigenens]GIJ46676.1 hypothetical protein Val02_35620 [Virgisporangium aliadipatigenens]
MRRRRLAVAFAAAAALAAALLTIPVANAVSGGDPVDSTDRYPWLGWLAVDGTFACGASLYAPDLVLTASHCVLGENTEELTVTFGALDRSTSDSAGRQVVPATRWHYVGLEDEIGNGPIGELELLRHDWALVKLAERVDRPTLPLATDPADTTGPLTIMGWGATPILRSGEVTGITDEECASRGTDFVPNERQLCTLSSGTEANCGPRIRSGDSGGPLVKRLADGSYRQVGVVSAAGEECASPTVFADLTHYAPNIRAAAARLDRSAEDPFTAAEPGRYPWVGTVWTGDGACMGSLYAPDVVLTSASCVTGDRADVSVIFGETDGIPPPEREGSQQVPAAKLYRPASGAWGLIKLAEPIRQPTLPIAAGPATAGEKVTVFGWARSRRHLLAGETLVVDDRTCAERIGDGERRDFALILCTASFGPAEFVGRPDCRIRVAAGQVGAPVVARTTDGRAVQVGVVARTAPGCRVDLQVDLPPFAAEIAAAVAVL